MNKFIILIATGLYFVFANWFICSQVGHECSSCVVESNVVVSEEPKIKGIEEFNLVSKIVDFSMNSAVPDTGYFLNIFFKHVQSVSKKKTLIIVGQYFDTEENNTTYGDLGIARADEVKQILLSKGISESNIELASEKKSNIENLEVLPNPSFVINWIDSTEPVDGNSQSTQNSLENIMGTVYPDNVNERIEQDAREKEIVDSKTDTSFQKESNEIAKKKDTITDSKVEKLSNKVILYFPFNSIKIKNFKEVDSYLSELAKKMNNDKKIKVMLSGHTDDKGSVFANNRVAHRRAKIIRDILLEKGVSRKQIATDSQGSTDPLVPNTTKKNRKKNRRVEVLILE